MRLGVLVRSSAILLLIAACSEEKLTARFPELRITVVEQDYYVASSNDAPPSVVLGRVPLHSSRSAMFRLENPRDVPLTINEVRFETEPGTVWRYNLSARDGEIAPFSAVELEVVYAPQAEDAPDVASVHILSNAGNGRDQLVRVEGTGQFVGEPDIEVVYPGSIVPTAAQCAGGACVVPASSALSFGSVALGHTGSVEVVVHNRASCQERPGVAACESCALVLSPNGAAHNVGVGWKAGTNTSGAFAVSVATPATVLQRDLACGSDTGSMRFVVTFLAPVLQGDREATLVIESNDPDEAVIEIPVRGQARPGPIAIARLRPFNAARPTDPFTEAGSIHPLDRVYLDGSGSYDPAEPANPARIVSYQWEVLEFPAGANPADFDLQGQGTAKGSLWLPLAGHYVARLTVTNVDGFASGDTEEARVAFDARPGSDLHVELTWDNSSNDQDLHLVRAVAGNTLCDDTDDCYYANTEPRWFSTSGAGVGPNPRLDIDDTNGLGPENINIDAPNVGTYRVYVHYWYMNGVSSGSTAATRNTVRIYLDGLQVAEYRRTLQKSDVWAVADISWAAGAHTVLPYAVDVAGEFGTVRNMGSPTPCENSAGWVFP